MMISTKGRYALRVMIDLAQHEGEGFLSLKSVAERQDISPKYLEMIVAILNRGGLVISQRGKEGGYRPAPRAKYSWARSSALPRAALPPSPALTARTVPVSAPITA